MKASDPNKYSKKFFIVIHENSLKKLGINDELNELNADSICKQLTDILDKYKKDGTVKIKDYYFSYAQSEKDRFHIHLIVTTKQTYTNKKLASYLGNCHSEDCQSDEEAKHYVAKDDDKYKDKGEVVYKICGNPDIVISHRGKRNDLINIEKEIENGNIIDPEKWAYDNSSSARQYNNLLERYNQCMNLKAKNSGNIDNLNVIFIEGAPGSGKSHHAQRLAKELANGKNYFRIVPMKDNKKFLFDGYEYEPVVWIDELRPNMIDTAKLFEYLDIYRPLLLNVKGGHVYANYHTVIISSVYSPDKWFSDDKIEDYDIKDEEDWKEKDKEFKRRITKRYRAICDETDINGNCIKSHLEEIDNNSIVPLKKENGIPEYDIPFI